MDHELLMQDLVTGYRTYAEPADLGVGATTEAPATGWRCRVVSVISAILGGAVGYDHVFGRDSGHAPGGPSPR